MHILQIILFSEVFTYRAPPFSFYGSILSARVLKPNHSRPANFQHYRRAGWTLIRKFHGQSWSGSPVSGSMARRGPLAVPVFMNNEPRDISSRGSLLPVLRSVRALWRAIVVVRRKTERQPPYLRPHRKSLSPSFFFLTT